MSSIPSFKVNFGSHAESYDIVIPPQYIDANGNFNTKLVVPDTFVTVLLDGKPVPISGYDDSALPKDFNQGYPLIAVDLKAYRPDQAIQENRLLRSTLLSTPVCLLFHPDALKLFSICRQLCSENKTGVSIIVQYMVHDSDTSAKNKFIVAMEYEFKDCIITGFMFQSWWTPSAVKFQYSSLTTKISQFDKDGKRTGTHAFVHDITTAIYGEPQGGGR